ncbi:DUF4236 domain-containing protein [Chryseobacterium sp. SSA4.19]|nr:DUF4236 domain-containing protein [Chryseobacterium sp. SSA4.19]
MVIPGIHLNISKKGRSTTVGRRGASVNFNSSGTMIHSMNVLVKVLVKLFK